MVNHQRSLFFMGPTWKWSHQQNCQGRVSLAESQTQVMPVMWLFHKRDTETWEDKVKKWCQVIDIILIYFITVYIVVYIVTLKKLISWYSWLVWRIFDGSTEILLCWYSWLICMKKVTWYLWVIYIYIIYNTINIDVLVISD